MPIISVKDKENNKEEIKNFNIFQKNSVYPKTFYLKSLLKHNLCWKIKFLKQSTYIKYVLAKLSKLVQISILAFSDSFLEDSLKIKKGPELVPMPHFS